MIVPMMMVWVLGLVHGAQEPDYIVFTQPKKGGGGMEEISIPIAALRQCHEEGHKILEGTQINSLTSCRLWSAALHAALMKLQVDCQVFQMGSDADNLYHRGVRIQGRIVIDLQGRQWSKSLLYGASEAYHRVEPECIQIHQEDGEDYYFYFTEKGDFNREATVGYPGFEYSESRLVERPDLLLRMLQFKLIKPEGIPKAVQKSLAEKAEEEQHGLLYALRTPAVSNFYLSPKTEHNAYEKDGFVYVRDMANAFHSILEGAIKRRAGSSATSSGAPSCAFCHSVPAGKLKNCSRCKKVGYCNEACQGRHWKQHKKVCKAPPAPLTLAEQWDRAMQDGKKVFVEPSCAWFREQLQKQLAQKKLDEAK